MRALLIPPYVARVVTRLEQAGFEAWLVGGCLRDLLSGRIPSDFDLATSAVPEDVRLLFHKTILTGEKYGTVTLIEPEGKVEVTAFRAESGYEGHRKPSGVRFGCSLEQDLSRRDFTINAMAYHPDRGLKDPFGGLEDLKNRIIRAVGKPEERFEEDALRILRAFRFAARLDFQIEAETFQGAKTCGRLVAEISGERIRMEMDRLLEARPSAVLPLAETGTLEFLGVRAVDARYRLLDDKPVGLPAKWAALVLLGGADGGLLPRRLKFDRAAASDLHAILNEFQMGLPETREDVKRRIGKIRPGLFDDYLRLCPVLLNQDTSRQRLELRGVLDSGEPYLPEMLEIDGGDLIRAGYEQGPELGNILRGLLEHVIRHPADNRKKKLLELSKK